MPWTLISMLLEIIILSESLSLVVVTSSSTSIVASIVEICHLRSAQETEAF